jgi:hypothetical protein
MTMTRHNDPPDRPAARGWAPYLLGWWLSAAGAVHADVELRIEFPPGAEGHQAFWAIKQAGRVVANGSLDCAPARTGSVSTPAPDGPATLFVAVNRDEYESFFPSFGDLYQQVSFEVANRDAEVVVARSAWRERGLSDAENLLTIHYHRFDGEYQSVGLWTWGEHNRRRPAEQETFEVGRDAYGLVFQIDTADYGQPGDRIGLLPRMKGSWQFKDGGDRYWSPELGQEVSLLQGRDEVFPSPPDISPKLVGAAIEADTVVVAHLSHRLALVDFPRERFTIRDEDGRSREVTSVDAEGEKRGKANRFRINLAGPLDFVRHTYDLLISGFAPKRITLGGVLVDPKRFYDRKAVLGAHYAKEATVFRVFSPVASQVDVVLAETHRPVAPGRAEDRGSDGDLLVVRPMARNERGVWSATVPGDWQGKYYSYRLRGAALDPDREVTDIYAVCTSGPGARAMIVDLEETDPAGFDASRDARARFHYRGQLRRDAQRQVPGVDGTRHAPSGRPVDQDRPGPSGGTGRDPRADHARPGLR